MTAGRAPILAALSLAATLGGGGAACAQLSGSVALDSDYRLRGYSLTNQRPALTLSLAYDHKSGFYAGGQVVGEDSREGGTRILGHTEYLGVAGGRPDGVTWDLGASTVNMSLYLDKHYPLSYSQIYAGLAKGDLSGHVYLVHDYPRQGVTTGYAEMNGVLRPAEDWRLTGHLGVSHRLGGPRPGDGKLTRYDVRLGVARTLGRAEVRAAYTVVLRRPTPRPESSDGRPGVSVGASLFF